MASAEAVAAVIAAGGAHVPELMDKLEGRLQEIAHSHGPVLAEHASATIAAGGKRLRPLLVARRGAVAGAPGAGDAGDGRRRADPLGHARPPTTCSTPAELRRGRPTVVATAGRGIATATGDLLFSRAFAELARNGIPQSVRILSDASSALADGELLQREDAWNVGVSRERYEQRCDLRTARLFPRPRASSARSRARRGRRARPLRPPHRPGLPDAR